MFRDKLAVPQPTQYKTGSFYTAVWLVHSLLHFPSVKAAQNSCAFNVNFLQHKLMAIKYRDIHNSISLLHLLTWGKG
jgi:hypothetical protein